MVGAFNRLLSDFKIAAYHYYNNSRKRICWVAHQAAQLYGNGACPERGVITSSINYNRHMSQESSFVCLHGLGRTSEDWNRVRPELEQHGPVSAPELPRNYVAALALASEAVAPDSIVVGHSFGALLAIQVAAKRQGEVAGVVLTDSFFPPARNGRPASTAVGDYLWHRYKFVTEARHATLPVGTPAWGTDGLGTLIRIAVHRADFEATASSVSAPVLVLHCKDDHYVPVDFAQAAVQRHPSWTYRELETGGHYPHLLNTEGWLKAVLDWHNRLPL